MKCFKVHAAVVTTAGAIACAACMVANAQERQLEEIVVTTERRQATEATTAISMEVFTGQDIASAQIKDIVDLQNEVPALQFFQNGSYVQANVRGVGNPSTGGPSEQVGVPVFFDGATQGEEMALASGFFDVGDVQVLRGPQGTFVGQSAAGGAILINSARPDFTGFEGYIEAQAGSYNWRRVQGAVNMPVTDKFATRLAYMTDRRDSYYDNVAGAASTGGAQYQPGEQQDANYRVGLLWEPTDKFSLYTKFERTELLTYGIPEQPNPNFYTGYRDDDGDPLTPSIPVTTYSRNAQGPAPGTGTVGPNGEIIDGVPGPGGALYSPLDPFSIANPNAQSRNQTNNRWTVEANYTFDSGITFRSLSSAIEMDRLQVEGGNSLVYQSPTGFHLGPDMLTWSQEFNIISPVGDRLNWLVGFYKSDRHTELSLNIPQGNPVCGWTYEATWTPCPTSGTRQGSFYWTSVDDVKHSAVYGQLNVNLTNTLELRLEGRYNDDDNVQVRAPFVFTFDQAPNPGNGNTAVCPGQIGGTVFYCPPGTPDFSNPQTPLIWQGDLPTGKVGLNWTPTDGHFFYAFVARGYKSGQSTPVAATQVVEEIVDDFELGWKGTLRPGLYAELGVYYMDYTDMQMSAFVTAQTESRQATTNVGDSTIQGIEGSLRAIFGNFGLNATFGYTDSELGEITTVDTRALPFTTPFGQPYPGASDKGCVGALPQCFDYSDYYITLTGAETLFAPKLTYNLSIDYAFQMPNGGTLTPRISYNHRDSAYESVLQTPTDRYYTTDEREVVDLSLSYTHNTWDVQLFATNVSDEVYIEGAGDSILYGDPRVWGLRVRYDFAQ